MSETLTVVALAAAYALLWRHAIVKGRRLDAERRRLARRNAGVRMQLLGEMRLSYAARRPVRLTDITGA